ncbi:unnamed protein product [Effrenium voratum]|nr:unnamed protein product [Effrenium voratum]
MLPGNRGADDRHAVSCQAPHLAGRDELIFSIQEDLLPKYGFEASKAGVNEMLKLCARHLADPEIARLFDDANKQVGMSPAACEFFRKKVAMMK